MDKNVTVRQIEHPLRGARVRRARSADAGRRNESHVIGVPASAANSQQHELTVATAAASRRLGI